MKNATKTSPCLLALLLSGLVLSPATEGMARDSTSYNPAAMQVRSSIPIGTIIAWPANSLPASGTWVECDGRNGTPDLRGRFIRGLGGRSGALGQVQAEETKAHFHTVQQHSHTVTGEAGGQEVVVTPQVVSGEASSQQVEVGSQEISGKAEGQIGRFTDVSSGDQGPNVNHDSQASYISSQQIAGGVSDNHTHSLDVTVYGKDGSYSGGGTTSYASGKMNYIYETHYDWKNSDSDISGKTAGGTYETKGGTITGKTAGGTYMTGGGTITGVTNMAGNNTDYTGGVETRPENVALRYIMKIR